MYKKYIKNNIQAMYLTLKTAKKSILYSKFNPKVGCVIVYKNIIIGKGFTQKPGFNHAEIEAIKKSYNNGYGLFLKKSKMYINLEPCCIKNLTSSCVKAIIKENIKNIFISIKDLNPQINGNSINILKKNNINIYYGLLKNYSYELNIGYFNKLKYNLPWIRLKSGCSIDFKLALYNNKSKWITNKKSRYDNHYWRFKANAIIIGINTIIIDNPIYYTNYITQKKYNYIIILDNKFKFNNNYNIFINEYIIIIVKNNNFYKIKKLIKFKKKIKIIFLKKKGRLNIIIKILNFFKLNEIQIESGSKINTFFVMNNNINEILLYISPSIIGNKSKNVFYLPKIKNLKKRKKFKIKDFRKINNNFRILLRK